MDKDLLFFEQIMTQNWAMNSKAIAVRKLEILYGM